MVCGALCEEHARDDAPFMFLGDQLRCARGATHFCGSSKEEKQTKKCSSVCLSACLFLRTLKASSKEPHTPS